MTSHTAAFPLVIGALVTLAEAAVAPVRVVRGRDISNDPSDAVMIGLRDVEDGDGSWSSAGTFQQTQQTFGGNREEVGQVNGVVVATNGQSDQADAMSTAFGYLALIETAVRASPTLGLTVFDYVFAELETGEVAELQDAAASTSLSFTITYKIRI